jgi:hypothetical protein
MTWMAGLSVSRTLPFGTEQEAATRWTTLSTSPTAAAD